MANGKETQPISYKSNPYDVIYNHFGIQRYRPLERTLLEPKDILEKEGLDLFENPFFSVLAIATNEKLLTKATESLAEWLMYKRGDELDTTYTEQDRIILAMCAGIDIAFLEALLIGDSEAEDHHKEMTRDEIAKLQEFRNDLLEQTFH